MTEWIWFPRSRGFIAARTEISGIQLIMGSAAKVLLSTAVLAGQGSKF